MEMNETLFKSMCQEWKEGKRTSVSIQKEFDITGTTFYRLAKEYGFNLVDEDLYNKAYNHATVNGKTSIGTIQREFSVGFVKARYVFNCLAEKNPKWEIDRKGVLVVN